MTYVSKWEAACGFFLSLKAILSPETKGLFYSSLSNCHEVGAKSQASLGSCMLTFFIPHVPQVFLLQQGFCVSEKELFCFLDLVILCLKIPHQLLISFWNCSGHNFYFIYPWKKKLTANLCCFSLPSNKLRTNFLFLIGICKALVSSFFHKRICLALHLNNAQVGRFGPQMRPFQLL